MNKCAIVTGGSRGIGLGIAQGLAREGYHLILTYVQELDDSTVHEISESIIQYGVNVDLIKANVVDMDSCQSVIEFASEKYDEISVLVNNAGITKDNLMIKMSEADFKDVIDVNLVGTFNMCKAIYRKMTRQKYGRIINLASVIGLAGNAGQANYAASKAGIIGMSKSLARELAGRNITVNCLAPGYIKTQMTEQLNENIAKAILDKIPVKRYGEIEDVVNAALFLASPNASYITGQVLNIDGGMVM